MTVLVDELDAHHGVLRYINCLPKPPYPGYEPLLGNRFETVSVRSMIIDFGRRTICTRMVLWDCAAQLAKAGWFLRMSADLFALSWAYWLFHYHWIKSNYCNGLNGNSVINMLFSFWIISIYE